MAFLVMLEKLSPVERAVFLMREVFDYDYDEIGRIVGKSPSNCRQLARRARHRIERGKPRFEVSREEQAKLTEQFFAACQAGDLERLVGLLDPDEAGRQATERLSAFLGDRFRSVELPDGCDVNELTLRSGGQQELINLISLARRQHDEAA